MPEDFRKEVHDLWDQASEADKDNRREMLIDLQMVANDQWDSRDRSARENQENGEPPRPCLTINTTVQFINQVVGDWVANPAEIKVLPRENGDKEVAEVRSELIRSISLQSKADRVYKAALLQSASCGRGYFRIDLDYAYEDAFERDLFIRGIANPLSVLGDPYSTDLTGRDAEWLFVADKIGEDEYKLRFPEAALPSLFDADVSAQGWCEDDSVRVAEYWQLKERNRTFALMQSGAVEDVTDRPEAEWQPLLYVAPDGQRRVRKSPCRYASMVLTNGQEELTDPFELKISRLPIIKVTGQEIWVGDKRVTFGLARLLRDHQRMKNYLRSVATEKLMFAPRANFVAQAASIKGRVRDWYNTLTYNDGTPEPKPVTESNLQALIAMSEMAAQDMKDVTGIHDASLGVRSNETSGIAIQRRQHEGDIATIVYPDNMNSSMQEGGEVLNELIPVAFDTPRTIRTIGQDDSVRLLRVNDPDFQATDQIEKNVNLAQGRYDVTISTGPAYQTKRQEAAGQLMELARGNQGMMDRAGDLIVKSLDIPDGDAIAERLAPPGTASAEDMTDEQKAAAAQAQQMQQMQQQMAMEAAQAELAEKKAQARKAEAEADEAEADADLARTNATRAKVELAAEGASLAAHAAGELEPEPQMEPVA